MKKEHEAGKSKSPCFNCLNILAMDPSRDVPLQPRTHPLTEEEKQKHSASSSFFAV